jgi:hypothetical protein
MIRFEFEMMHPHDAKRMAILMFSFSINALVCQSVLHNTHINILQCLRVTCFSMIWMGLPLAGMSIILNWKKEDKPLGYSRSEFTVRSVMIFVYGMGFFLFASIFSLIGLALSPLVWYGLGMAGLAIDDSIIGQRGSKYPVSKWVSVGAATLALFLLWGVSQHSGFSLIEAVDKGDWMVIIVAVILPLLVPMVPYFIRNRGVHSTQQVVQYMTFGYPTLLVLAIAMIFLVPLDTTLLLESHTRGLSESKTPTLEGNHTNASGYISTHADFVTPNVTNASQNLIRFDQYKHHTPSPSQHTPDPPYIEIFIPFTIFGVILVTLRCILDHATLDVVCVNAIVTTIKHLMIHPECPAAGPAALIAAAALTARIINLTTNPTQSERIPTKYYANDLAEYEDF